MRTSTTDESQAEVPRDARPRKGGKTPAKRRDRISAGFPAAREAEAECAAESGVWSLPSGALPIAGEPARALQVQTVACHC
jgi:hypothetical protein